MPWLTGAVRVSAAVCLTLLCVFIGPVSTTAGASDSGTAEWMPFVGTEHVACTQGNPSPGGVCDDHHSYPGAVDLNMPEGTPVRASGPGVVVYVNATCAEGDVGCEGGAGRWVGVEHPDGRVSRYMHLSTVSVTLGREVARGEQLAVSGQTGNAVVPHLHYDEQEPLWTRAQMGEVLACHGSALVRYPTSLGYGSWAEVPYGTELRNDGYVCHGPVFVDVAGSHPFRTEIEWMAGEGLTTGYPDGTFRPTNPVTRQAISAYLHRLAGAPPGPFPNPGFSDVSPAHPFITEISWMLHTGRADGFPDETFRPLACVTRQAAAAFLHRESGAPPGPFPNPGFSDVSPAHPFITEISWMVAAGVADGYADGTFRPQSCVSRQATAAFLYRLFAAS